jgi:signal peptidase II
MGGNWSIIHFTENNGMAFGLQFGAEWGKLFLSVFRIIAVLGIGWYLLKLIRQGASSMVIITLSLIFAGAVGNIIDSVFYGVIFTDSYNQIAEFMPEQGYAGLLHGKVVDMLYFPIIHGHFPEWFPIWPSEEFIFFRPVFNIADAAITIGVFLIIFFQKEFFAEKVQR